MIERRVLVAEASVNNAAASRNTLIMSLSHRGFCLAFDVCSQWSEGIEQLPLFSPLSMLRKAKMFSSVDAELQKLNYRNLILNTFYSSPKMCMHGGINGTLPEVMAEYF